MSFRVLTEEQEKEIVSLYKSGVGMRELYYEHGYSSSVVNRVFKKYGVKKKGVGCRNAKFTNVKNIEDIAEQPPIDCNKQGKKCMFHMNAKTTEVYRCNYCAMTGKLRGGDPHSCTKYRFK